MKKTYRSDPWGVSCRATSPLSAFGLILAVLLSLALQASDAHAADLYLKDEREIYLALDKLNAMGQLPGFLANTRPYNIQAVRAAVDNAAGVDLNGQLSDAPFAQWVAFYANPTAVARGTASLSWADRRTVMVNSGGVPIPKEFSTKFSALGRYEPVAYLSASGKGMAWFGEGGDSDSSLGENSIEFGNKYISLVAGKITTWYGPGRNGSLIFTDNAEPYPGVRLHNPVPIPAPWIFSFLGNLQYDLFLAQLDGDRPIPDSRLFGMRVAARPSRYFEIGLSRAIHYGGEGRSNSFSTFWGAFTGNGINKPGRIENELAGLDVEVTLPFKAQPFQLYFEMAGEDQHTGNPLPFPEKFAYLGGVFLPTILGNSSIDLRIEYATNHVYDNGPSWYIHGSYPHEYKGQVLGHPMGTDARNLWLQAHWFFLPSTYLEFGLDWTNRYSLGPLVESTFRWTTGLVGWLTKNIRMETDFTLESQENPRGISGASSKNLIFQFAFSYQLSK